MIKRLRKGFTLVELVIVIAVIAVLAAVLIPTFSDIIEKANNSADLQEARNLFSEALIEDPTITDGTVYVQLVKDEEIKYVIFTDGAPVDNNKNGNYTDEENIPAQEDLKALGTNGVLSKIYKNKNEVSDDPINPDHGDNPGETPTPNPDHEHIRCATCGKCTVEDCSEEKCTGDHHTHLYCEICGKCEATGCSNTEKCTGNHQPSDATSHVFCEFCGNCTIESCTEHTKCNENHAIVNVEGVALNKDSVQLVLGRDSVTLVATVFPANATNKNVIWTSSNPEIAIINDGVLIASAEGIVTITVTTEDGNFNATCTVSIICNHNNIIALEIQNSEGIDPEKHQPFCNTCHKSQGEPEPHTFVDGACICTYEKTYTFVCSKHATHTYPGTLTTIKTTASNESCDAGHNLPNHYDCPWGDGEGDGLTDCTGCLAIDRSGCADHDKSKPVYTGSSIGHLITCNDCNESWTEKHDNGLCKCGYCAHSPKSGTYSDLGNGWHQYECQHCHKTQSESHTVNGSYESDAYKHIGTCKHCNASMEASHSGAAGTKCDVCQYKFCGHSEEYFVWKYNNETNEHYLVCNYDATECKGHKIILLPEPHSYDNEEDMICNGCPFNRGKCEHTNIDSNLLCTCGWYVVSNWSQFTSKTNSGGESVKVILNGDVTILANLTKLKIARDTIVDLNGHTFTINSLLTINDNVTVELKDESKGKTGKIAGSSNFSLSTGSKFILNAVTVNKTNTFVTAGKSSSTIIIKSSTITTTGHIIANMQYENVTLNIENTVFNSSAGKYVIYSTTSNSNASGSITVKSSTVNGHNFSRDHMSNINEEEGHIVVSIQ